MLHDKVEDATERRQYTAEVAAKSYCFLLE